MATKSELLAVAATVLGESSPLYSRFAAVLEGSSNPLLTATAFVDYSNRRGPMPGFVMLPPADQRAELDQLKLAIEAM